MTEKESNLSFQDDHEHITFKGQYWDLAPKYAHPNAQRLLTEDIFWKLTNETTPFGSDDGADTLLEFLTWREKNPLASLIPFIKSNITGIGYSAEHIFESDIQKIKKHLDDYEWDYVTQDMIIVSTAFAQFIIEGIIDEEIRKLALIAIDRQAQDYVISMWALRAQEERLKNLGVMKDKLIFLGS